MKNKRSRFLNKIIYLVFLIFVTATFFSKTLEFKFDELIKSVATGTNDENKDVKLVDGKLTYTGPDIRILEIEPADSFRLTYTINKRVTTGTETITKTKNNKEYKIEITHMTMAEFIGKTEKLNGKYDAIVIGRYIDNSLSGPNGTIDYSDIKYDINKHTKIFIKSDLRNKSWFTDYAYLENDITNKKAKEIREFIQSGQLVYIDKTINQQYCSENSNNNYYYSNNISWTKLHYHLTDSNGDFLRDNLGSLSNFIRDKKIDDINIDDILNKYIEQSNKNLTKQIIYSNSPEGDTFEALGDINRRNMIFNITSKEAKDEDLTINLYLDINGDGLYKEDEIVKSVTGVNLSKGNYKLEYNIYEDYPHFIGYLDWKIEAVKNNEGYDIPIKSYYEGNILFRRLKGEEQRKINVLQVLPISKNNPVFNEDISEGKWFEKEWHNGIWIDKGTWYNGNLNLDKNTLFQNLLNSKEVADYDISIDVISYEDFYRGNYLGPGKEELNKSKYDMIIMGFADMYPEEGVSEEAVKQLKAYVTAGKSLMLTHDTLTYWKAGDRLENASHLMTAFRDISGQSRYIDKLNPEQKDLNGQIINHDPNNLSESNNAKKANGSTFVNMYTGVNADTTESNKVYRTNKTVVTSYPFEIKEDEIPIRETHGQYFQLNLEDEDTVPILNLTEQNNVSAGNYKSSISFNNRYDSRNFYYTYSRGNITFSGTGENGRDHSEYPESEMKLFINTIVKAERSANHKPIISGLTEDKATEVSFNKDFNFNIVVKDPDKDNVRLNKIWVNTEDISLINNLSEDYNVSGTSYALKISKEILAKYINKEVTIKIEAEDKKGAISIKEYKIKVVSDAIIVPKTVEKNLIINQKESFTIDLETENDSNPTSINVNNNIENPQIEGIFGIKNIKVINDNGKLKLEIEDLIAYQKEKGKEIDILIKYNTGSKEKNVIIKIIYNSDYEPPNIIAELQGDEERIIYKENNIIEIEYKIKPQDFTYNNGNNTSSEKDVLFLIDTSNTRNNSNLLGAVQNQLHNQILSQMRNDNVKYSIITFNDEAKILFDFSYEGYKDGGGYENSINEAYIKKLSLSGNSKNIGKALSLVQEVFKTSRSTASKNIVILSNDDVTYTESEISYVKNGTFNVITMSYNNSNTTSSLYNLHKNINGKEDDILFAKEDQNAINNYLMGNVREKLKGFSTVKPYLINPVLNINLGDKFEAVDGITSVNDNIATIEVPTIVYNLTSNNNYHAEEQEVKIILKTKNLQQGIYTFGSSSDNIIKYNSIINNEIVRQIKTPTIIVENSNEIICHGIYNGINENSIDINETNGLSFIHSSKVSFGSLFKVNSNDLSFDLKLDDGFKVYDEEKKLYDIELYRLEYDDKNNIKYNQIDNINIQQKEGNNLINVSINNFNNQDKEVEILLIYKCKIKEGSKETLTNSITLNNIIKDITINILPKDKENNIVLPDLF